MFELCCVCGVSGPLASLLIGRYGCSVTILLGGLLSSLGLLGSAYAANLYMVFASYGAVSGETEVNQCGSRSQPSLAWRVWRVERKARPKPMC